MAFPTSPTDGQIYQSYKYNATTGVWKRFSVDDLFPIGMLYTQYPGKSSPSDLGWPGTWENKSSEYAGDFFRAEGGDALAFDSGEQLDQMQRITGNHNNRARGRHDIEKSSAGVFSLADGGYGGAAAGGGGNLRVYFDSANSPNARTSSTTNGETRPVNKTIRIWERTA
jgi:hypothetical protein